MSFSSKVRQELCEIRVNSRHCQLAEISAIVGFCGRIRYVKGRMSLYIQTENLQLARKCFTLIQKTFNITTDVLVRSGKDSGNRTLYLFIKKKEDVDRVITALKLTYSDMSRMQILTKNSCCKRAFLRGSFIAAGSISDPEKSYHYEISCDTQEKADSLKSLISSFDTETVLSPKVLIRKNHFVMYVKDASQIVDILNIMGAHSALMRLEELRVFKEMRGSVNRIVNCETANINKVVSAAMKQIDDIKFIRDHGGFGSLSEPLLEIAELRLEHPDIPLKELGELLDPQVGKSGVNHRLRKLGEIADKLKEGVL